MDAALRTTIIAAFAGLIIVGGIIALAISILFYLLGFVGAIVERGEIMAGGCLLRIFIFAAVAGFLLLVYAFVGGPMGWN
jgi:hypothetical protein